MRSRCCRTRVSGVCLGYAAVALAGCAQPAPKPVEFSETTRDYRASDYPSVYQKWTRHAKLVRDVGTVIEAWATYKSWDFRQAYVSNYVSIYDLSDSEQAALMQSQLDASRAGYEFHLAVQTTSDRWNDLERKTSPWRVTMLDGAGNELGPTSIRAVKLPELYESQFFPSRTEFTRSYEIGFPRFAAEDKSSAGPVGGRLVLRFTCPMGGIELVWESR